MPVWCGKRLLCYGNDFDEPLEDFNETCNGLALGHTSARLILKRQQPAKSTSQNHHCRPQTDISLALQAFGKLSSK